MNSLITKVGVRVDKFILKIYSKTKLKILKSYLQKRVYFHAEIIEKSSKEIIDNGSETDKRNLFKILTDILN